MVLVLLERGLVLKVGRARREASCLGVEVEGAVDARVLVRVLLQRLDEVGEHRVDRAHLARARARVRVGAGVGVRVRVGLGLWGWVRLGVGVRVRVRGSC